MTGRDVHLPVAAQPSLTALVGVGERAEALGYGRAWAPETWGRDAVTALATIAARTGRIGLGTSITPVYSRSPALIGQTAATLHEASGGRFRLGLGPSGPAVIERWHGVPFDRPLRTTREALEVVRGVLSGDVVDYDGEVYDLGGFRLRFDPPDPPPAIDAAGMGPTAVELAGRFADGWHAFMLTPDGLRDRLDDLRRGAALGDRDPGDLRTTLVLGCCALEDGDRARALARRHLAFYVGAMGTFYRDALAAQGHEAAAAAVDRAWRAGDRDAALAAIDDALLDGLAAAGTPDEVRQRVADFEAIEGVDAVAVGFPRGADPDEIESTMAALAPDG